MRALLILAAVLAAPPVQADDRLPSPSPAIRVSSDGVTVEWREFHGVRRWAFAAPDGEPALRRPRAILHPLLGVLLLDGPRLCYALDPVTGARRALPGVFTGGKRLRVVVDGAPAAEAKTRCAALHAAGLRYFERADWTTPTKASYRALLARVRKEDEARVARARAAPAEARRRRLHDCVRRASQLQAQMQLLLKPGKPFDASDHRTFQRELLAQAHLVALARCERLIRDHHKLLLARMPAGKAALRKQARVYALEMALYYHRTVAKKVQRLKHDWWTAKLHVILCHYRRGMVRGSGDDLRYAYKLILNLQTLYPGLGGTAIKPYFQHLRLRIKKGK